MIFVLFVYSFSLYGMLAVILKSMRGTSDSVFWEAFYMLAAFLFCKASATAIDITSSNVALIGRLYFIDTLSSMLSVVANVFLFQAAIDFLLHRSHTKIRFRAVPLILFTAYLLLYISGLIPTSEVDQIGRLSFGYNSAILNSIAMFNLYFLLKNRASGLIVGGIGFIVYAVFEGIVFTSVFKISPVLFRMSAALMLFISSFSLVKLLAERPAAKKVDYL